jgi:hypothetical protein
VTAPAALSVTEEPKHKEGEEGEMVRIGTGLINGFAVKVDTQFMASLALTEYPPAKVGVTTTLAKLEATGAAQVKLPTANGALAVNVVLLPGQTVAGFAAMVMLGPGLTLRVIFAELEQVPDAPITV